MKQPRVRLIAFILGSILTGVVCILIWYISLWNYGIQTQSSPNPNLSLNSHSIENTDPTINHAPLPKDSLSTLSLPNVVSLSASLQKLYELLPLRERLSLHVRESESIPEEILEGSQIIADIETELLNERLLYSQVIVFYERCALDQKIEPTIRALCYFHLREKEPSHPVLTDPGIPRFIIDSANLI